MSVGIYFDVHIPQAVADQLRRSGIDVLTAIDDHANLLQDEALLDRSAQLGRVLLTFDVRFKALAEDWQRKNRPFSGLIYAHPLRVSIGQLVQNLELIAQATDSEDWRNAIEYLPL
jgi:hypothetical protein